VSLRLRRKNPPTISVLKEALEQRKQSPYSARTNAPPSSL
jgi:hypothetical protein